MRNLITLMVFIFNLDVLGALPHGGFMKKRLTINDIHVFKLAKIFELATETEQQTSLF